MVFDLLFRLIYRREIAQDIRDLDQMQLEWRRQDQIINQRLTENFARDEWAAVRERCERRLAETR